MIKARATGQLRLAWTLLTRRGDDTPPCGVGGAPCRLHTLFRETTDRLAVRLVGAHRPYRRLRIGSVSPILDVSNFTVKGHYFAHVPYEPEATNAVLNLLEPGGTFFDIGANAGYFTVLAALRVGPKGRVWAFSNPTVRQQLRRHIGS